LAVADPRRQLGEQQPRKIIAQCRRISIKGAMAGGSEMIVLVSPVNENRACR